MGLFTTNFINSLINNFFNFLRKIKFKSLYGFSLYELFRLYLTVGRKEVREYETSTRKRCFRFCPF